MLGVLGRFSNPLILWVILQVTRNHQIILRAQPEIKKLRVIGLSGSARKAIKVKIGAAITWPIKNSADRKNNKICIVLLALLLSILQQ
jgi:hypothetical protein